MQDECQGIPRHLRIADERFHLAVRRKLYAAVSLWCVVAQCGQVMAGDRKQAFISAATSCQ